LIDRNLKLAVIGKDKIAEKVNVFGVGRKDVSHVVRRDLLTQLIEDTPSGLQVGGVVEGAYLAISGKRSG
jgi:hypothetical protein